MVQRLKIVVMLGGPSAEREVSLRSGAGVVKALRSLGHTVVELDPKTPDWVLPPDTDVVFLALHGTYGEDGTVQGQLEKLGVPYTGCDAEASRIAFDKVLTKQRCIEAGRADGKISGRGFGQNSVADGLAAAAGRETGAAGFERRPAICRARRGLAKGAGGGVEI